jgi:anti-sigma regulatory factor (Ser/Thr protein kinase)
MRNVLSIRLPPDSGAPGMARAALQELPSSLHARLDEAQLLVSELVTNSLQHVHMASSDRIELVVLEAENYMRVEIKDPGDGYEEALTGWNRVRDRPDDKPATSGYGLSVVATMADRSGVISDNGTVVWFELDLNGKTTSEGA